LFAGLPRRYDVLAEVLSFGQNRRWRAAMVDAVEPAAPARLLDVAAGTAGVSIRVARRTDAAVVGLDLSEAMLATGRAAVARAAVADRVALVAGRAEQLPFRDGAFDALTFTYLLRYVGDPAATLRELTRVLRPGSPVASLEFAVPPAPWWRACWWLYTRLVLPLAGAALGGRAWYDVGRFLGPSISGFYRDHPLRDVIRCWRDAGIVGIAVREMSLGGGVVIWGRTADG
jgi:demethylmenaquinone methyltransferase/2-methoxy-6-polyprenyl-1,4-benzoquinol methylase